MHLLFTKVQLIKKFKFLSLIFLFYSCVSTKKYSATTPESELIPFLENYLSLNKETIDDPKFYDKEFTNNRNYNISLSEPFWIIPSSLVPKDVLPQKSNNNVSIYIFNHKLYLAFRTGKTHFAGKKTGIYVISTNDGKNWNKELEFFNQSDAREPFLIAINDSLRFYFFTAGKNSFAFEPQKVKMYSSSGNGDWTAPKEVMEKGEVHWSMLNRNEKTYMTSYTGSHYQLKGESKVKLKFQTSENASDWKNIGNEDHVYFGGVSETAFEFDKDGNLWAIGRLEDGDSSGFGTQIYFAKKDDLSNWEKLDTAINEAYMSPKMFRYGNDLFLIGRKQLGKKPFGHFSREKSMKKQRIRNWVRYSLSPKSTAIYKLNTNERKIEWVKDMPGAGDNAFPSIIRLNKNQFLVANYTSPPHKKNFSWLRGQLSKTMIYLQIINFTE